MNSCEVSSLYRSQIGALRALAHSILKDKRQAEEVVQQVFVELIANADEIAAERAEVRAWLMEGVAWFAKARRAQRKGEAVPAVPGHHDRDR